ncbi:MAG TPA: ABC transporter substrate-binding protein [Burkholderiaceae bacterium]|nr:ABC transporter substrate-binding protein [Burkholderiaceae bacterium]
MNLTRRDVLAATGIAPAAALAQSPRAGARKVLRLALASPETAFDPVQTNSDRNTSTILSQILEAPLGYDYLARPARLVPVTAAALPDISADGRQFTLRIRPGIFFADDAAFKGKKRELTAADHVYAIKRFYDPKYNSSDLYVFESSKLPGLSELRQRAIKQRRPFDYDAEVEGVRALDRYTLRITLGVSNPRFVYVLADPVFTGAVAREVVEFYGDEIGAHPVGTGAFRLKSWRRASRTVLERSPSWRSASYDGTPADEPLAREIASTLAGQALPFVDEVVLDVVEEDQPRWLTFLNGRYAWLPLPGPYAQVAAPNGELAPYLVKRGVRLQKSLQPDMGMTFFFMEHPLVGGYTPEKVALRRAIGLAFDGDAYIRRVLGGLAIPAQSTIAPFTTGYDPAYKSEMSDFDPARAKALLDLYGYVDRNADGWREQPDGSPLVLKLASLSNQRDRTNNELWRRCMTAVGLRIEFEIATWPELLKRSRAGTLMMWGYGWTATSPDGGFFLAIAYGPNAGEANDPRFALPAFDRVFERQLVLPDGPEREAELRRGKDLLVAYLPFKVHGHRIAMDLVQTGTKHYWRHPFMRDIWRFVDVPAE